MKETIIINLFSGPGAGKSVIAAGLYYLLVHDLKYLAESVPEYAKELVYANNYELLKNQQHLFDVQSKRIDVHIGKMDVVISDSPILLNFVYNQKTPDVVFNELILTHHHKMTSLNYFIQRGDNYEGFGRIHDEQQSLKLDDKILTLLQEYNIKYKIINRGDIKTVANDIKHYYAQ